MEGTPRSHATGSSTDFDDISDLEDVFSWCVTEGVDVLDPESADIRRYLDQLRAGDYSPNTIRRRLTTLRAFYRQLVEAEELERSPIDELDESATNAKLTLADLDETARNRLLQAAAVGGRRDMATVRLLLDGLTVSQICRARVEELHERDGRAVLVVHVRGAERPMRLSDDTKAALLAYLRCRTSGPLLLDRQGNAIDRFDVRRIVRRLAGSQTARLVRRRPSTTPAGSSHRLPGIEAQIV